MYALTLKQPWASLIAEGVKDIEYRSWAPRADAIGQDLAIHAGSGVSEPGFKMLEDALERPVDRTAFEKGAVLAVVRLERAVQGEDGGWEWLLSDPRYLNEPVECTGKLRLWTLPPEVEDAVQRRLRGGEFERPADASAESGAPTPHIPESPVSAPKDEAPSPAPVPARTAVDDEIAGWVVKGIRTQMSEENWQKWLTPEYLGAWWTRRAVKTVAADLPVFFFKGAPASVLIGEGRMTGAAKHHANGLWEIGIEATRPFPKPIPKRALQEHPVLGTASFVKIGPVGTFYPLTSAQVAAIRAMAFPSLP